RDAELRENHILLACLISIIRRHTGSSGEELDELVTQVRNLAWEVMNKTNDATSSVMQGKMWKAVRHALKDISFEKKSLLLTTDFMEDVVRYLLPVRTHPEMKKHVQRMTYPQDHHRYHTFWIADALVDHTKHSLAIPPVEWGDRNTAIGCTVRTNDYDFVPKIRQLQNLSISLDVWLKILKQLSVSLSDTIAYSSTATADNFYATARSIIKSIVVNIFDYVGCQQISGLAEDMTQCHSSQSTKTEKDTRSIGTMFKYSLTQEQNGSENLPRRGTPHKNRSINTSTLTQSISRYERKNHTVTGLGAKKPNGNQRTNWVKGRQSRKTEGQSNEQNPQSKKETTESQHDNHIKNCRIECTQRTNQTQEIETTRPIKLHDDRFQNYQILFRSYIITGRRGGIHPLNPALTMSPRLVMKLDPSGDLSRKLEQTKQLLAVSHRLLHNLKGAYFDQTESILWPRTTLVSLEAYTDFFRLFHSTDELMKDKGEKISCGEIAQSANLLAGGSVVRTRPLPLDFRCPGLGNLIVSQSSCLLLMTWQLDAKLNINWLETVADRTWNTDKDLQTMWNELLGDPPKRAP
ncbi:hypothetical protein T265_14838, partial [Opisthorchis viverrini]